MLCPYCSLAKPPIAHLARGAESLFPKYILLAQQVIRKGFGSRFGGSGRFDMGGDQIATVVSPLFADLVESVGVARIRVSRRTHFHYIANGVVNGLRPRFDRRAKSFPLIDLFVQWRLALLLLYQNSG